MTQLYPSELQQNFDRGSFSRVPGNNVIYSEMEIGPTKKRRRSTLRKDTIEGTILLKDNNEFDVFLNWFTFTLEDGVNDFYFEDPVTKNQIIVGFQENGMSIDHIGFEAYRAKMVLEVKSE